MSLGSMFLNYYIGIIAIADKLFRITMDIILFLTFTIIPPLLSAYFSYILATVKGYPKVLSTILALVFGVSVPLILFLIKPKENVEHPLFPGGISELFMKMPAAVRRNPKTSTKEETGYLYLAHDKLIWVPKDNSTGYVWGYELGLPIGGPRIYKSGIVNWMLFPGVGADPIALTLGTKYGFTKLHLASTINAMNNGDTTIIERLKEGKNLWKFGRTGKEEND